jgi:sulfoxide reductase catalytic subunit YedY
VTPADSPPPWSQRTQEDIGTGSRIETQNFNGYGEYVAGLYKGMEKERLFM